MSGCERGCIEVVRRIMEVYGNAYKWLNEHDLAFWKHCEDCDVEVLRLLIGEGLDVNGVDRFERTPLIIACILKKVSLLQSLIVDGVGVDITMKNKWGQLPLTSCFNNERLHLLPIFRQAYIQQHILIPPQLISFPNTNSFSSVKIESSRFLFHYVHHRMSSCQIRGYMDKRGLVLNGVIELMERFPDALSLRKDEGKTCGYKMDCMGINSKCAEALLFWESEGAYQIIG